MCIYLYANLCEGQNVTREAAEVWCKWASSGKTAKDKKSCHIFTRSICGNQAAGKAEEDEEAEEVAVSTFFTNLSLSLSLAAAHGVSGQRSQALTRWLPGFQSLAPADIMRGQRVGKKTLKSANNHIHIYIYAQTFHEQQL